MDNVLIIQILMMIILGIIGFFMARLFKSVDNLYRRTEDSRVKMQKKVTLDEVKVEAAAIVESKILEHVVAKHVGS